MEAFRTRLPNQAVAELKEIEKWCRRRALDFKYYAVRAGSLMHAKPLQ